MIIITSNFIFNFTNFCVIVSYLTKLLTLDILFSTAVRVVVVVVVVAKLVILGILFVTPFILELRAVVVAMLLILGISFLTSFILALRVILVAKLVISGVLSSIFLILALYKSFLTTSVGTFFSLSMSNLSTLDFKLAKSTFLANLDVSTPVAFFKSAFVA